MSDTHPAGQRRIQMLSVPTLAVAALALTTGCKKEAPRSAPPPAEVGIVTVAPAALPISYEFSAEVQPYRRVNVRARVDGVIMTRGFTEGQSQHGALVL